MRRFLNIYHFQIGLAIIILVGLWIAVANVSWGKFLSGWDTLHPEFDLTLYTQRVIFGSWQEHQGLGAPASQAHLAELPRLPLLYVLTALLPLWSVRYVFMFVMYILGGVGTYLFITQAWFEQQSSKKSTVAATLGALFYLLNLGTLQQFYVPLEMFAVHFATIGFILLATHKTIQTQSWRWYLAFFVIQFLSAPSAHTATLFYMYNVVVFAYALALVLSRHKITQVKVWFWILLRLGILTLFAHWYWLLPNLYYVLAHSEYVSEAKISRLFSNEAFWQNQAYGAIPNVIILKNFLFNWKDFNFDSRQFVDLFDEWQMHLEFGYGTALLFTTSLLSLAGIPLLLTKQPANEKKWPFLIVLAIPFFFLVNYNFPFTNVYGFLRQHSGILEEALRFPFTKFSILWILGLSVSLATFINWSLSFFSTLKSRQAQYFSIGLVGLVFVSILGGSQPAWQGNLISQQMKVEIPDSYFELFEWLAEQPPTTRLVKFPLITFTGWNYYDWPTGGYQGAGFTWFGISQPTLDREFDRWVRTDESFYHEVSQAVKNHDQTYFELILQKYDISWLLYDSSIFNPYQPNDSQPELDFRALTENNPRISLVKTFGTLEVYQVSQPTTTNWLKSVPTQPTTGITELNRIDPLYEQVGDYVTTSQSQHIFPFSHLLAERIIDRNLDVTTTQTKLKTKLDGTHLVLPAWSDHSQTIPVKVSAAYNPLTNAVVISLISQYPEIKIGQQAIDLGQLAPTRLVSLDLPTTQTNQIALSINGTFYDLTDLAASTTIGPLWLELDKAHTLQLFSVIPDEQETVSVQAIGEAVSIDQTFLSPLLFPATQISVPNQNVQLEITVPYAPDALPLRAHSTSQTVNCSNLIGAASKEVGSNEIVYRSSKKGNACDRFTFAHLSAQQDYLLQVRGFNTQGMPLKFNVNRLQETTPYLEEMLDPEATISNYSILSGSGEPGLELHLASLSFGSIETVNTLENIHFHPVPLNWLARIHVMTSNSTATTLPPLSITQATRHNATWYSAQVKSNSEQSPLILSQSYDPGWIAFIGPPQFWQLTKYQRLPHTQFNNWANAWLIPDGDFKITIIYLPQLLSYLGYGFATITTIFLIQMATRKSKKTRSTTIKNLLRGRG